MPTPLFPLHVVLFPGATCPLHVFEERYRVMMDHVLSGDRSFGVVAIRRGPEVGGVAEVFEVGTMAEIASVQRSQDGRMAIVATGTTRFRIVRRLPDDPYPVAETEALPEHPGDAAAGAVTSARAALHRYLSAVAKQQGADVVAPALGEEDPVAVSFALAEALQVDLAERQRLLEAPDAVTRLRMLEQMARAEARLMEAVGPPVGRPAGGASLN